LILTTAPSKKLRMKTIYYDSLQKAGKHTNKHEYLQTLDGYELVQKRLLVGDYMLSAGRISVDTKANLQELWTNVKTADHRRFKAECIKAQELEIQLYVLTETTFATNLDDLKKWREPNSEYCSRGGSPRLEYLAKKNHKPLPKGKPRRAYGSTLAKSCRTMEEKYGVRFLFCDPNKTGERIIEILETPTTAEEAFNAMDEAVVEFDKFIQTIKGE
jgi:hypothetical protein